MIKTAISLFGAVFTIRTQVRHPLMLYPTIINIAAKQLIGIYDAYGIKNNNINNKVNACTIPATGVLPPFFTLAAVLAIAPVAGIPPKKCRHKVPYTLSY